MAQVMTGRLVHGYALFAAWYSDISASGEPSFKILDHINSLDPQENNAEEGAKIIHLRRAKG